MTVNKLDKKSAAEIIDLMLDIGGKIDRSIALVQNGFTEEEFLTYRKMAGEFMGGILIDVMNPIFSNFPELKPNELK